MESREILKNLREQHQLTQEQMAERLLVTRQAVSRWETGETQPNTDTLRLLSMSEDGMISREPDGSFNEDYCMWCYTGGRFVYETKESLLDFLLAHTPNPPNQTEAERRSSYDAYLSELRHWKKA